MSRHLKVYTNFGHGVYDSPDTDNTDETELLVGYNVDLLPRGGYEQRAGSVKVHDWYLDTVSLVGLTDVWPRADIASAEINDYNNCVVCNLATVSKIYRTQSSGSHVLLQSLNQEKFGTCHWYTNDQYFVDGNEYYVYDWDLTTWGAVSFHASSITTEIRACEGLFRYGTRMYAWGNSSAKNTLYFSEQENPTYFAAGSELIPGGHYGRDEIQALAEYNEGLIIFRKHDIWVWYGIDPTSAELYQLEASTGTVAPRTILHAKDQLLFLGDDSIYALRTIEKNLTAVVDVTPGLSEYLKGLDEDLKYRCHAFYENGAYIVAVVLDGQSRPSAHIRVHLNMPYQTRDEEDNWKEVYPCTIYTGWNNYCTWRLPYNNALRFFYNGVSYKAFTGTDDYMPTIGGTGTAISASTRHRVWLTNRFLRYKVKSLLLLAKQYDGLDCDVDLELMLGADSLEAEIDFGAYSGWDVGEWDSSYWDFENVVKKEIRVGEKMDRVEFTLDHSAQGESFLFYGFGVVFKKKKPKGGRDGITYL